MRFIPSVDAKIAVSTELPAPGAFDNSAILASLTFREQADNDINLQTTHHFGFLQKIVLDLIFLLMPRMCRYYLFFVFRTLPFHGGPAHLDRSSRSALLSCLGRPYSTVR